MDIIEVDSNKKETKQNLLVRRILMKRLTKLICTIDEKWNSKEKLYELLNLGVDAIEIFSELDLKLQKQLIEKMNEFEQKNGHYIPILYNISYYHIYASRINNDVASVYISQNEKVYFTHENMSVNSNFIITEPKLIYANFTVDDVIHINYGEISFKVEEIGTNYLKCNTLNSSIVPKLSLISVEGKEHFSSNLIENNTSKLIEEIQNAIKFDLEYIVISVIKSPIEEINQIKSIITQAKSNIKIIVKIDNIQSIETLDDYLEKVDGIYFSRNDLNLKESLSKICYYQKSIISKCTYHGIPIIVAGTFLDTMRTLPNPTRAETSDIFNTILLGIDALLLTNEITSGIYPLEVVQTINEICPSGEKRVDYSNLFLEISHKTKKPMRIVEAVASSTVKTSFNLQSPVIVCVTEKGTASYCVAKFRPYCPILAVTSKVNVGSFLGIVRGQFAVVYENTSNIDSVIVFSNEFLVGSKIIPKNVNIIFLSGLHEYQNGTIDQMRIINLENYFSNKAKI